jgi:hypothetical protein
MPRAYFPANEQVQEFLRSDQKTMCLSSLFAGIGEARQFVALHSGLKKTHSTQMSCSGIGKKAKVDIEKTTEFFETT